jgi:WD40 repeat protein
MPVSLPPRPNLDYYRKQAKALLRDYRAGDAAAISRVERWHPRARQRARGRPPLAAFRLADAQWVIAREHGIESWPKFATRLAQPEGAVQLQIVTAEINLCAFMQDGRGAVTSAEGNVVQAWDARTGLCLRAFEEGGVNVWGLAGGADGRTVLIGGRDGTARLMDVGSGQLLRSLAGHHSLVRCLDMTPDCRVALSGELRDPRVRLWDVDSERCIQAFEGHTDGVYAVAIDGMRQRALSGSRDATVRLWDLATGKCTRVLEGHTYHVQSVAWSMDGRRALSCSQDVRLWDLDSGRCLRVLRGHTETIRSVSWSPDQRKAVSASHDGSVRVWDVERGECLRTFEGHAAGVLEAVWSADGRRIHSCDWTGGIRRWDAP